MLKQSFLRASRLLKPTQSHRLASRRNAPRPPAAEECCGSGCSECTYLIYAEALVDFYKDGGAKALTEVQSIPDPSVRVFVQTELKFYLSLDEEARQRVKKHPRIEEVYDSDDKMMTLCKGAAITGVILYAIRKWVSSRWAKFTKDIDASDLIIVITGATSGIGKATAEQLLLRGATVVLACRDVAKAKLLAEAFREHHKNAKIFCLTVDLADFDSVDSFCRVCKKHLPRIDVLILNAGVAFCPYEETKQGLELQMGVNYFGHARLTLGLLSLLKKGKAPRLVHLSSSLYKLSKAPERIQAITGEAHIHDLCMTESNYNSNAAYNDSKLAGMLFTKEISRRYPFLTCFSVSPGIVATKLGRHRHPLSFSTLLRLPAFALFCIVAVRTPLQGCQSVLYAALDDSISSPYGYYRDCREENVSKLLMNIQLCEKLFLATQEIFNHCDNAEQ